MRVDRYTICAVFALAFVACSQKRDAANAQDVADSVAMAARRVIVSKPAAAYREIQLSDTGSVTGHALFTGVPHGDTLVQVSADQNGCGKPLTIDRLDRKDGNVANVVVWLTDVRAGKSLPLDRRFNLENSDCMWDPVVQAIVAGGTMNISNDDPLVERAYILQVATGDTVGVAPFTDAGQVIPYDQLFRAPGVRELSIESRPMSRAWVVVLDHPYFAVTKGDGSFTISGIPAGTHTIRAWHPLLGIADGTVRVTSGQTTTMELHFR